MIIRELDLNKERDIHGDSLRVNEWITPEERNFSYKIFWPYVENPLENDETIDVFVRFKSEEYVITYLTINESQRWFERAKKYGNYANGVYIPLGGNEILLEQITNESVQKSIEDLISRGDFFRYFEKVDKS